MTNWSLFFLQDWVRFPTLAQQLPPSRLYGETQQSGVVELPQPFHRLKWRQTQALPGEAQSSPFRKFGTFSVDQKPCIYTVVVCCISLSELKPWIEVQV